MALTTLTATPQVQVSCKKLVRIKSTGGLLYHVESVINHGKLIYHLG